ncbi:MAG: CDP-alcohol phosphatidyltransferase family protein [Elusimicrobia bacterium]|nr:CDP-alcohol phosphatidyltransferase family protein [Elusimicrobiota bacterium]
MSDSKPLYKAYEMEERLDIWFYHPLGHFFARLAFKAGLTPDQVTYVSMALGLAGGLMLSSWKTAFWGFVLLVFSSVLDSADGQLARMRGGGTLTGRILDGLTGYFMFTASYLGLVLLYMSGEGARWAFIIPVAVGGGVFSAVQSSLYDFYRTQFAAISKKRLINPDSGAPDLSGFWKFAYSSYGVYQRAFAGSHLRLRQAMLGRCPSGVADEGAAAAYVRSNRKLVHGWNLLGDNTRFIFIALALLAHRPELCFFFIMVIGTAVLALMVALQAAADKELLRQMEGKASCAP